MSVNKVILIGNLGQNPETSYTQGGTAVTSLSLATSEKWTDKATGEKKDKTTWHRVKFFGKAAETIAKYTHKGSKLFIEGKINNYQYEKDGQTLYGSEIIGENFQFLSSGDTQQTPLQLDQNQATPLGGFSQQQQPQPGFYQQPQQQQKYFRKGNAYD